MSDVKGPVGRPGRGLEPRLRGGDVALGLHRQAPREDRQPLDGGQAVQGMFSLFMKPGDARSAAGYLGATAGMAVVGLSLWLGLGSFLMLMGGYCAYISYQSARP